MALGANLGNLDEFARVTRSASNELQSTTAWVGFLLEYLVNAGLVTGSNKSGMNGLIDEAHQRLDRHPTCSWGKKSIDSKYFNEWRLHASKTYLDQMNSAATFE
jgi:hypothetical protein